MRVLITDSVSEKGIDVLKQAGMEVDIKVGLAEDEIVEIIGSYEALVVRSQTKVTRKILEKADAMKIIGRAGVGVDNIDVDAATEKGIIVVNAPEGNTIAATEHTIALMLALARNVPQAHYALTQGVWDRKKYMGVELRDKVLGVLGLGKIGSGVVKRALAMDMKVLAYDPYVSPERAQKLGVEITGLDEIYEQADFISVHLPMTEDTRYIIGAEAISKMKPGVRIINVARGGVVDEKALYDALVSGKVAGAAIDVWETEPDTENPLQKLNNVVVTPHLGASTKEAQVNVAIDVAEEIVHFARGEIVRNAVNAPSLNPEILERLNPYLVLSEKLGSMVSQTTAGNVEQVNIQYNGDISNYDVGILTSSFLRGLLRPFLNSAINFVNAPYIARSRGIKIKESKSVEMEHYTNLIAVTVKTGVDQRSLSGTVFNQEPRIVSIDGYSIDAVPEGHMLVVPHIDKPRIIGPVATTLGDDKINIGGMQVGRKSMGGEAVMFLMVDGRVPEETLKKISQMDGLLDVKYVFL